MQAKEPEMTAQDVIAFVQLLDQHHIDVYIDGGWGVDALLGEQTRIHADLDIAVEHKDVPQIRTLLEAQGYRDVPRDDTRDCNFVLGDDAGHLIDFHSYTFDAEGKCVFGVLYPFDSLSGTGSIGGFPVKCISPEWIVKFHTGYPLDEDDYHDVKLLCERFGITLPQEYDAFAAKMPYEIVVVAENEVTSEQADEMLRLQIACFADQVTAAEIEEDFDRPATARVLVYHQDSLIACAEVFKREVEYDGQKVVVGGFSPCTRADWRGQGIATRVCQTAMDYLRRQGCDVAFLSVDTARETHSLYERLGFRMLPRPYIYANTRGELKESDGGMIVPLCSPKLCERVLRGEVQFALAPEVGYW